MSDTQTLPLDRAQQLGLALLATIEQGGKPTAFVQEDDSFMPGRIARLCPELTLVEERGTDRTLTLYMTRPVHSDDVERVPLLPFALDPKNKLVTLMARAEGDELPSWHLHCHRDPELWLGPVMTLLAEALAPAMAEVVASGVCDTVN